MRAIFLDIETTGLDPFRHSPIDIAFRIADLSSDKQELSYRALIYITEKQWAERDLASIKINGYTLEKLKTGKLLKDVHKEIVDIFTTMNIKRGSSVFICQNPAFDRAFFSQIVETAIQEKFCWPYHWLDLASMYWSFVMQKQFYEKKGCPKEINLSKDSIAHWLGLPPETRPHSASNGVDHLMQCYNKIFSYEFQKTILQH